MRRDLLIAVGGILIVLWFTGCGSKCEEDCGECGTLDEEICECIITDIECGCNNGKLDGDEVYIDCGGSCDPCECTYDPCLFLTGGDDKLWTYVQSIDASGNVVEPTDCDKNWRFTFFVERVVELGCPLYDNYTNMRWEFDDPEEPEGIVLTDGFGNQYVYLIETLSADTLRILEQVGFTTYVAE